MACLPLSVAVYPAAAACFHPAVHSAQARRKPASAVSSASTQDASNGERADSRKGSQHARRVFTGRDKDTGGGARSSALRKKVPESRQCAGPTEGPAEPRVEAGHLISMQQVAPHDGLLERAGAAVGGGEEASERDRLELPISAFGGGVFALWEGAEGEDLPGKDLQHRTPADASHQPKQVPVMPRPVTSVLVPHALFSSCTWPHLPPPTANDLYHDPARGNRMMNLEKPRREGVLMKMGVADAEMCAVHRTHLGRSILQRCPWPVHSLSCRPLKTWRVC